MNVRYGDYAGMQGKRYRLWQTENGYEVEQTWGGNGVIYRADTVRECKAYLKNECRAKRILHQ